MSGTVTIRVSAEASRLVAELAKRDGTTMRATIDAILEREADRRFLLDGFAELEASPPETLAVYDAEFAAWDAADLDSEGDGAQTDAA